MNVEAKGQLYDILIALGQHTLDHYNPCDWRNGKCRRMRLSEHDEGCCVGCEHLGAEGCTVKSLACKLWLCEGQRDVFRECEIELKVLRQVADSAASRIKSEDREKRISHLTNSGLSYKLEMNGIEPSAS